MSHKNILIVFILAFSPMVIFAQALDINTATAEQMSKALKGIGPKKAADIVKYREVHGPFKSTDDLAKVPGIKGKILDKIKPMVSVSNVPTLSTTPEVPAMPTTPAVPTTPVTPPKP